MSVQYVMAKIAAIANLYPEEASGNLVVWNDPKKAGAPALTLSDCRVIRDHLTPPAFDFHRLTSQEMRLFEDIRNSKTGLTMDEDRAGQPLTVLRNLKLVDVQALTVSPGNALVTTSDYGRRSDSAWHEVRVAPFDLEKLTVGERTMFDDLAEAEDGVLRVDLTRQHGPATALESYGLVELAELRGMDVGMADARLTELGKKSIAEAPEKSSAPSMR